MKVRVSAPSRLHVSLLDVGYATPRIFGGVGIVLESPRVVVEARPSERGDKVQGAPKPYLVEIERMLGRLRLISGKKFWAKIDVCDMPEPHVGLGSKTAVLLAAAMAACQANGWQPTAEQLQNASGRGGTSGIGIHAFFHGGILFDGGHATQQERKFAPSSAGGRSETPPLLAAMRPPDDWCATLIRPSFGVKISGSAEQTVFDNAPVDSAEILRVIAAVHQGIMPAVALNDLNLMAEALDVVNSNGFKKLEINAQPIPVRTLLTRLRTATGLPVGMSSMGSTIFVVHSTALEDIHEIVSSLAGDLGGSCVTDTVRLTTEGYRFTLLS